MDPKKAREVVISSPVYARYVILVIKKWNTWPGLRVEFLYDSLVSLPKCLLYSKAGKCRQCESGYDNIKGICKEMDPGCLDIDENTGLCSKCAPDYYFSAARKCQAMVPGCAYIGGACASCLDGWRLGGSAGCVLREDLIKPVNPKYRVKDNKGRYVGVEFEKIVNYYYIELTVPG